MSIRPETATRLTDCLLIAAASVAAGLIIRPFQNVPFIDDWVYAWTVQHLLETGELRIVEYSSSPTAVQALWATLFCLPFGFSFTALRISTWVLGTSTLWALYLLLRHFEVPRAQSLFGVAVMGVCPQFVVLSASYITDVPCLAAVMWSMLLFLRGVARERAVLVWTAVLITCLGIGSRLVAIGVAGACSSRCCCIAADGAAERSCFWRPSRLCHSPWR